MTLPAAHVLGCQGGESTAATLGRAITAVQDGEPLAPVEVIVPTGVAGVTLRRAAAGPGGWANVRFSSLPQLAERLCTRELALTAGPLRRPLAGADRGRAVRETLAHASGDGLLLRAARAHRVTAGLLEQVFAELDAVDLPEVTAGLSRRAVELLALYAPYRDQIASLLTPRQLLGWATSTVSRPEAAAVPVVLVAAGVFTAAEKGLLNALGGRLTVVIPPVLAADTAAWLGVTATPVASAVRRVVIAPDAEEEVRIAVRTTLAHLAATSCRPERVGIAYTAAVPYVRLLAEQLTVAGVPHHVPPQRTLAQTITGRAVPALLGLHARGFPRADLLAWMSGGPILGPDGRLVPASSWDRLSREAGVFRGVEVWRDRLTRYAQDQRDRAAGGDAGLAARYDARATGAEALLAQVEQLHAVAEAVITAGSWPQVSSALLALLRRVLGSRNKVDRWRPSTAAGEPVDVRLEQDAYDAVVALLHALGETTGPVSPAAVTAELAGALTVSVPSGTTLGRGVLVGSLPAFLGADLDLLLILGCAEGALPSRQAENVLLADADRVVLSAELTTAASRRLAERQRWDGVLSSAPVVHLSYPRADTRAQRRSFPSPWLLEQATRLGAPGAPPISADELDAGSLPPSWLTTYPSFEAALRRTTMFANSHELDVAWCLQGKINELAAADTRLARGLAAAGARAAGRFDQWSGQTGPLPEPVRSSINTHLSATGLQTWATCPASHFYGSVLGVRDLTDPGSGDNIEAREKGSLVHDVLAQLIEPHLRTDQSPGLSPDTAWSEADLTRALQLLDSQAADLTARGLTGREVLWTAQLARLRRTLVRVLAHDSALRKARRSAPVAVEAPFGRDGAAPLVIDLPGQGAVPFAGYIDRIDVTDSGALVVVDYKTGTGYGYDSFPKHPDLDDAADLLDRGRKLQLLLYGLAARQLQKMPGASVQAWFWFVEQGELQRGGLLTGKQEQRLTEVLDLVVGGIRGGLYPAYPGKETWRSNRQSWENCSFCTFHRVCPTTRAEQWAALSAQEAVLPYAALTEPAKTSR